MAKSFTKNYFDNEQGGAIDIDSMGGTTGGDASSDGQACTLEQLVDSLLMEASEAYERSICESKNTIPQKVASNSQVNISRFAAPKTNEDVDTAVATRVPKNTQTDTKYCVELWRKWSAFRNSIVDLEKVPEDIEAIASNVDHLQYWLCCFVLEVRKKDGSEYPPNTIHRLCCGLLRHTRQAGHPEINIFKDTAFSKFTATLDSEMKRLRSLGFGSKKRQAEPLTTDEEEIPWQTGHLGDHSPQALLDTIIFMNGIYFALRSGQEHRNLRFSPPQIELCEPQGQRAYLKYTEDV